MLADKVVQNLKKEINLDLLGEKVEPELLFLGTGSTLPTLRRNNSAIYYFSGEGVILMDCGEGTYA